MKRVEKKTKKVVKPIPKNDKRDKLLVILIFVGIINIIATIILITFVIGLLDELRYTDMRVFENQSIIQKMNTIVLVDDESWVDVVEEKTTLAVPVPSDWNISSSKATYCSNSVEFCWEEHFEVFLDIGEDTTYDEFVSRLYSNIKGADENNIVQSFKDGGGYYEIASFNEATNNNMYFDEKVDNEGNSLRHKVKTKHYEDTNQVIVEIDVY